MNVFIYILIFILGITFGSFLTLASYRIPLNQDITHERSYCPNCKYKLAFLDLIPVFSYIFLRGKCRYCKKKISPRYMIIELCTGIFFVLYALTLDIKMEPITATSIIKITNFIIGILYIILLFLVGTIDKEHRIIDKRVLIYGVIISFINVIKEYIFNKYFYIGGEYKFNSAICYFSLILIVNIINILNLKKNWEYYVNLIIYLLIIGLFTNSDLVIFTIIFTLLIIAFKLIINKIANKKKEYSKKMPVAYYLTISNFLTLIVAFCCMMGF